jgi:hypothetical protein
LPTTTAGCLETQQLDVTLLEAEGLEDLAKLLSGPGVPPTEASKQEDKPTEAAEQDDKPTEAKEGTA